MRLGICDMCEDECEVMVYADDTDCWSICARCNTAMQEAWDSMSPDEQAKARADA